MKNAIAVIALLLACQPAQALDYRNHGGPFLELGAWFGGDKVATNPDGDSYRAGSGALLGGGYSHEVLDGRFESRNAAGLRYQGGDGENRGLVLESLLVKSWDEVAIGAGVHADLFNAVEDIDGRVTRFKPAIGPVLMAEWMMSRQLSLIGRVLFVDFETEDGASLKGTQAGVFVTVRQPG